MLVQFAEFNLEFLLDEVLRVLRRNLEQLVNTDEQRFFFRNHTRVGRNAYLTIGEGIERVNRLIGTSSRCEMYNNLDLVGRDIFNFLNLDFPLVVGLQDGINQANGIGPKWNLGNGERLVFIVFSNARTHTNLTSTQTAVVVGAIGHTTRLKVGH